MRIAKRPLLIALSSVALLSMLAAAFVVVNAGGAHAATISGQARTITKAGASTFTASALGTDTSVTSTEFANANSDSDGADASGDVNRSLAGSSKSNSGHPVQVHKNPASIPALNTSFDGLNFFDQRYANHGNQFSIEPPDQGMCAGNGFVFESINDVMQVYDTSGNALTGVVDLNTFYGYPPAIVRSTRTYGPELTDPSCLYDAASQRWFNVVLTLDRVGTSSHLSLVNHLDLAVSQTADPRGAWNIYKLDVTNDGTNAGGVNPCPCLGDYPHIGADANGFYITTNSYPWLSNGFDGAQIYAFNKAQLAAGAATVTGAHFDTFGAVNAPSDAGSTQPGFTVWPAQVPGTAYNTANGGTEYFMSSNAAAEAKDPVSGTGSDYLSSQIVVWTMTNTASLNKNNPNLSLSNALVSVNQYSLPPKANQQSGNTPLVSCLNTSSCATNYLLGAPDPYRESELALDSNDTRMQQVMYANGELWSALDTGVTVNNNLQAGIAYYVVNPSANSVVVQDTVGIAGDNLTYPAVGVTSSGRGVMAFTVSGNDFYPSAGYAAVDDQVGVGAVNIAAKGAGPDDGFTGTNAEDGSPPRPRWGDYGSAFVDGNSVWLASEYVGQTCNLQQYLTNTPASPLFTCGYTRGALGNWDTRISEVTP